MQRTELIKKRILELIENKTVDRAVGWRKGEFFWDASPAVFNDAEELESFVYDSFCGPNLSKFLVTEAKKDGRVLVCAKPCDTYSLNQLFTEHRIDRSKLYILGIGCDGMLDAEKIRQNGIKGMTAVEEDGDDLVIDTVYGKKTLPREKALITRCRVCRGGKHAVFDELLCADEEKGPSGDRFEEVEKLERMTPDERFEFWRSELSKCIRCNACRNACPACTCEKCVFDNDASGIASRANSDSFEEKLYHIIRSFHVCGRCTDCGECSRVCPQGIPLHLLNRKYIKDINELYGFYQAGEKEGSISPVTDFEKTDADPSVVRERGGAGK
ncbi:MAG: 4Fe-4S dicluster domain-containing protein [Clostridia bacterium]|nr:4Fe-4S dicluster domain-containing protein [Clostridia bacterium]